MGRASDEAVPAEDVGESIHSSSLDLLTRTFSVGRKDDVIVHSTGEKTLPVPIEGLILTSPLFVVILYVVVHGLISVPA